MRMLFFAHSGLRHLVLLAGLLTLLYLVYAVATKAGNPRVTKVLGSVFIGALDLQVVIGLIMVAMGLFYSALLGHLFMMIAAALVAHASVALARSSPGVRADQIRLMGVAFSLLLIVAGIMSIGRSLFGTSGGPTIG